MHGQTPALESRYGAALAVMQEMHWSWPDLIAAPFDLVQEIEARLAARQHWESLKAKQDKARAQAQAGQHRGGRRR